MYLNRDFVGTSLTQRLKRGAANAVNFNAAVHEKAAGWVKWNAAFTLGAGAIASGQAMTPENVTKQLKVLAYDMDNVATGSVAIAASMGVMGKLSGAISKSKTLKAILEKSSAKA